MKAIRRQESGFSAVEMLITIIVIGLVFSAFVTTFTTLSSISLKSKQVTLANNAAFSKMQEYENMAFASLPGPAAPIPPAAPTTSQVEDFSASLPTVLTAPRTGTVSIKTISATLKQVIVVITYGSGGTQKTIQFDNFIQQTGVAR